MARVAAIITVWLLLLGSVLTACSGSDDGDPTATPTSSPTTTPQPSPTTGTPSPTASPSPTPEPTVPTLEGQAERVLRLVPTRPANINLFTSIYLDQPVYPQAYPDGAPMEPASGTERSAATMRNDLNEFLTASLGSDAPEVAATLALFDDETVMDRVPDPSLRAAFVLLNVTVARPLIDSYLTSGIYGGTLDWIETGRAFTESSEPGPDGKQRVGMSDRYRYEHFAAIAPNIIHAMLHHDETFSYPEDVTILTISTISYLQLVEMRPEITYQGTELSRFNNTFALALLNSHRAGSPDIELIVPGGASVLPGSPDDAPDFWTMIVEVDSPSIAPDVAGVILSDLLQPGTTIPQPLWFSRETVELIGGNIDPDVLSPVERLRLSVLLTMISTDEVAALLNLTREETVETFGLAPIEAVLEANR